MAKVNRRQFLKNTTLLGGSLAAAGMSTGTILSSPGEKRPGKGDVNDTLRVAVVGVHGRGMEHIQEFAGNEKLNCVVATVCDADEGVIGSAMKHVEAKQGKAPKFEQDLRRVLSDKSIDIVTTATPNHWHALVAIWAMQAGKDVYVEKPACHEVMEGRRMIEAARKYNRICQVGMQSRSMSGMQEIMEYLHSGKLGKVKVARGLCYKLRPSIGKTTGEQPIPKTISYDLWTGPAPLQPLHRKHLHYDWHWFWDFGNGDIGNQGIHEMDKARWGLGKNELPRSVMSVGGRFGYVDDGQTPNTQICVYDFGDCELIFEVRGLPSRNPFPGSELNKTTRIPKNFIGNVWYGSQGTLVSTGNSSGYALNTSGEIVKRFKGDGNHFANFIKAVRSRKSSDLTGDIQEGHLSAALCHLGNISYRLGTMQPFSKDSKAFGDDKEAFATLEHMADHLEESRVPLETNMYRVGRKLTVQAATESFVGDPEADRMLTREYRKPYVVPDKV
jgi:predicted dehydrogenase